MRLSAENLTDINGSDYLFIVCVAAVFGFLAFRQRENINDVSFQIAIGAIFIFWVIATIIFIVNLVT